jgi:hypothetical protein
MITTPMIPTKEDIKKADTKLKKGLLIALCPLALMIYVIIAAAAVALIAYIHGSADNQITNKEAKTEQTEDVTVPKIADDTETEGEDIDPSELITDTAPKPDEGKEIEYSIQHPDKVKE